MKQDIQILRIALHLGLVCKAVSRLKRGAVKTPSENQFLVRSDDLADLVRRAVDADATCDEIAKEIQEGNA